jgi:hypothetical protein
MVPPAAPKIAPTIVYALGLERCVSLTVKLARVEIRLVAASSASLARAKVG